METSLLNNNQIYNQQAKLAQQKQQQGSQPQFEAQPQAQSYGTAKDVAMANTNAGYVASKFEIMQHPVVLVQNIVLGLAAAIGITQLGNYLVGGNLKNLTHQKAFEKSPLYSFGQKIDSFVAKIPGFNSALEGIGKLKNKITGTAAKSDILAAVGKNYKEGTHVVWNVGKSYEEGKGTEAMQEFIEFLEKSLEKSPDGVFNDKKKTAAVNEILDKVKNQKLSHNQAGKMIIENKYLEDLSAEHLDKLLHVESKGFGSLVDKAFGTTPNLQSALSKAKFFNGQTEGLKPVSRAFNKLSLMMMEGVGGGVLGGKQAMIMSIMGLVSAFNAGSKAMVAKREKEKQIQEGNFSPEQVKEMKKGPWIGEHVSAFMEDFAGFTLGGYLMTFPIGVALNKYAGLSNLGRDAAKVKEVAKHLGVPEDADKAFHKSTMKYNDILAKDKKMQAYLDVLEGKKKPGIFSRIGKALGFKGTDEAVTMANKIQAFGLDLDPATAKKADVIKALKSVVHDKKWHTDTRKMILTAAESKLTIGSIFKGKEGNFLSRLAKYAVHKPLELSAKILGVGKFKLFSHDSTLKNIWAHSKAWGGGLGRIGLVAFVLAVPFRNAFMQVSHKIFGKPSFSQYDELKGVYDEEKIKAQTVQATEGLAPQKIKLPNAEQQPIMQQPAYQQQVSEANPYTAKIPVPDEKQLEIPSSPVRKLDTYTYVPKA